MFSRKRAFAFVLVLAMSGCSVTTKDNGSIELFFGTSLGARTTSATTNAEASTALHSQPVEDWIKSKTDANTNGVNP